MKSKAKYISVMGLLIALALTLTTLENFFSAVLPVGIRLGLANIVIMFALISFNGNSAFTIVILKSVFVLLTRGITAFSMSFCGGILAFATILIVYKKKDTSLILMSVLGAVAHNIGQLAVAAFITHSINTLFYLPLLLTSGVLAGICTAVVIKIVIPAVNKINLS